MRVWIGCLLLLLGCGGGGGGDGLEFADVAQAVGLAFDGEVGPVFPGAVLQNQQVMQRNMGSGAAVGDFDGDGDLDVYVVGHAGIANRLFRNNLVEGSKTFSDVTPALLADTGLGRLAHFVDLDNDGDLDLLLINDDDGTASAAPSRLFRNDGGGAWTDVTAGSGFRPIGFLRCGCAIADYDRDGRLDIFVTNWGYDLGRGTSDFPGSNQLFRNLGGFVFEDVSAAAGLGAFARDSFTAIFTDFDDDGFPDIHLAVDHAPDRFYFNRGGVFSEEADAVDATHIGNDMGVAAADFDDDGDLDLYATNITDESLGTGTTQGNVFYVNRQDEGGGVLFVDEAVARGALDTHWGWGVEFVDLENDGDLDIVAVNGFDEFLEINFGGPLSPVYATPAVVLKNDGAGRFARRDGIGLAQPDDGRALIAFDFDRDGDQDLLITNVRGPVRLFENRTATPGHWLAVALAPDNRAIGARVFATIGAVTKRRDVIAGRSYLAGTPSEVHFGLGAATRVDRLRILWADGTEQTLLDVAVDRVLRLTR